MNKIRRSSKPKRYPRVSVFKKNSFVISEETVFHTSLDRVIVKVFEQTEKSIIHGIYTINQKYRVIGPRCDNIFGLNMQFKCDLMVHMMNSPTNTRN